MSKIISHSELETLQIASSFANKLKPGDSVFLYGDLGFGKTTFVKGIAKKLGVKNRIISPTFPIIRRHSGLYHIDLYRIEGEKQLDEVGLPEILEDRTAVKFIEWPEKIKVKPDWVVKFEMNNDSTRTIIIDKYE